MTWTRNYYQINSISLSVCARGLDVKKLVLVVNYDCPNHYEDYVHRYLNLLINVPTRFLSSLVLSKNLIEFFDDCLKWSKTGINAKKVYECSGELLLSPLFLCKSGPFLVPF